MHCAVRDRLASAIDKCRGGDCDRSDGEVQGLFIIAIITIGVESRFVIILIVPLVAVAAGVHGLHRGLPCGYHNRHQAFEAIAGVAHFQRVHTASEQRNAVFVGQMQNVHGCRRCPVARPLNLAVSSIPRDAAERLHDFVHRHIAREQQRLHRNVEIGAVSFSRLERGIFVVVVRPAVGAEDAHEAGTRHPGRVVAGGIVVLHRAHLEVVIVVIAIHEHGVISTDGSLVVVGGGHMARVVTVEDAAAVNQATQAAHEISAGDDTAVVAMFHLGRDVASQAAHIAAVVRGLDHAVVVAAAHVAAVEVSG